MANAQKTNTTTTTSTATSTLPNQSQITSLWTDMTRRPRRYLNDIRQCAPLSFSTANVPLAGTTGLIGGFAVGAIPAMAMQASVSVLLAAQQIRATYKGESYSAPMKTLGIANLTTAGAMLIAGVASGTALGLALATFSSAMFATWGMGHLYLHRFVSRIETIQKEGKALGETPEQIQARMEQDLDIAKFLNKFQGCYGVADIGAILNAAAHGKDFQALAGNMGQALMSWETLVPLAFVSLGLSRAFSKSAAEAIDRWTPDLLKRFVKSPNAAYSTACGLTAGVIGTKAALAAATAGAATLDPATAGKLSIYLLCAHGYMALDEARPLPESADDYARAQGHLPHREIA